MHLRTFAKAHSRTLKAIPPVLIVALLLALSVYECLSGGAHIRQFVPHEIEFPVHNGPLATDRGYEYVYGKLVDDGKCILIAPRHETPDRGYVPVWPPGYSLVMHRGRASILSPTGRIAARPGDWVRVSFDPNVPRDPQAPRPAWVGRLGGKCAGQFILVGDDVSAIDDDKPSVVELSDPPLFFPRAQHYRGLIESETVARRITLELSGSCLVLIRHGDDSGYYAVWPPGFWPYQGTDGLEVRNGGGKVLLRPGDEFQTGRWSAPEVNPFADLDQQCQGRSPWYITTIKDPRP